MGTDEVVDDSVEYTAPCQRCGADASRSGGQVLRGLDLDWDVWHHCAGCGAAMEECGFRSDIPEDLRRRLIAANGPARVVLVDPSASAVAVMKVLRDRFGGDLAGTKRMLREVREGAFTGTLPEMAQLARLLGEAGVPAAAERVAAVRG